MAVLVTLTVVGPQLTIADATVFADQTFTVPLTLTTNGTAVTALTFAATPLATFGDPTAHTLLGAHPGQRYSDSTGGDG